MQGGGIVISQKKVEDTDVTTLTKGVTYFIRDGILTGRNGNTAITLFHRVINQKEPLQ